MKLQSVAPMLVFLIVVLPISTAIELGAQSFPTIDFSDTEFSEVELEIIDETLTNVTILPDSGLYPFKRLRERAQLFFTLNKTKQAQLHMDFAKERLKESYSMLKKDNKEKATDLIGSFTEEVHRYETLTSEGAENLPQKEHEITSYSLALVIAFEQEKKRNQDSLKMEKDSKEKGNESLELKRKNDKETVNHELKSRNTLKAQRTIVQKHLFPPKEKNDSNELGNETRPDIENTTFTPGDQLYPFKKFKEDVQLFFTLNKDSKADLRMDFAKERLREAKTSIEQEDNISAHVAIGKFMDEIHEYEKLKKEGAKSDPKKEQEIIQNSLIVAYTLKEIQKRESMRNTTKEQKHEREERNQRKPERRVERREREEEQDDENESDDEDKQDSMVDEIDEPPQESTSPPSLIRTPNINTSGEEEGEMERVIKSII